MSTLNDNLLDTIEFLVNRHRLHTRLPVELGPLLDRFEESASTISPP